MQTIRNRLALVLAATALGASLLIPAAASADQDADNTAVAANVSVGSAFVDQDALAVAASDQDVYCLLVFACNP
jgi:hypothetical protein